jgi:DNA-directed RNA polymerase specialized sigma subunit
MEGLVAQHHFGQMRLAVAQAKAERIIGEELRRLGGQEAELASRRKRDPEKLEIAVRLRKETTLSVKEIAARLQLSMYLSQVSLRCGMCAS